MAWVADLSAVGIEETESSEAEAKAENTHPDVAADDAHEDRPGIDGDGSRANDDPWRPMVVAAGIMGAVRGDLRWPPQR